MQPISSGETPISLRYVTLSISSEGLSAVHCLNCQKRLDVHQPDADLPYRMLATCEACKSWHVVNCDPIEPRALITLLPEPFLNGEKAFD